MIYPRQFCGGVYSSKFSHWNFSNFHGDFFTYRTFFVYI